MKKLTLPAKLIRPTKLLLLLPLLLISLLPLTTVAQQKPANKYRVTRTLIADLNNDHRPDTIRLISNLADWNSFTRISISLAGYGKTTFKARDYWTVVDSAFLANNKNAIHTKLLFFKSTPVHTVILLFGELTPAAYRSEFSIINIENNKVKMVMDAIDDSRPIADIEIPATLTDLNHDGRLDFVHTDFGEIVKQIPAGDIGSYNPYVVYPVRDTCKQDEALTHQYNAIHYVNAGPHDNGEILVLYPKNGGKPRIWREKGKK